MNVALVSIQMPNGMHHRWATLGEAERMSVSGQCRRIRVPGRKCIGKAKPIFRMVPVIEPSASVATAAALTPFDTQANLGLAGTKQQQADSRLKIEMYAETH